MTKREVIRMVLDGERPPYVPWSFGFTYEARLKLHYYYSHTPESDSPPPAIDLALLERQSLEPPAQAG